MAPFSASNTNVLGAKDTNVPMAIPTAAGDSDIKKDLEYHRQVLKSKMEAQEYGPPNTLHLPGTRDFSSDALVSSRSGNKYISPSDEIMSPCTAKLNALRNKQVGKYEPFSPPPPIVHSTLTTQHHRVKPKSLFAQASSKRLQGQEGLFGPKATPPTSVSPTKE